MKSIEEIENMSIESLDMISKDSGIGIPESFRQTISVTARTLELAGSEKTGPGRRMRPAWISLSSVAAAAAVAVIVAGTAKQPKDTFCDPLMAYSQLEETFDFISDKMSPAVELAESAQPIIDKTISIISK